MEPNTPIKLVAAIDQPVVFPSCCLRCHTEENLNFFMLECERVTDFLIFRRVRTREMLAEICGSCHRTMRFRRLLFVLSSILLLLASILVGSFIIMAPIDLGLVDKQGEAAVMVRTVWLCFCGLVCLFWAIWIRSHRLGMLFQKRFFGVWCRLDPRLTVACYIKPEKMRALNDRGHTIEVVH